MPGKAAKVQITERQMELLEEIAVTRTAAVRLVQRARIVLLAFQKLNNEEVGEVVGLNPQQVSVWRKRWKADWERLIRIECNESKSVLKKEIETLLDDLPRTRGVFCSENLSGHLAVLGDFDFQNIQPWVAHARRVCIERDSEHSSFELQTKRSTPSTIGCAKVARPHFHPNSKRPLSPSHVKILTTNRNDRSRNSRFARSLMRQSNEASFPVFHAVV